MADSRPNDGLGSAQCVVAKQGSGGKFVEQLYWLSVSVEEWDTQSMSAVHMHILRFIICNWRSLRCGPTFPKAPGMLGHA